MPKKVTTYVAENSVGTEVTFKRLKDAALFEQAVDIGDAIVEAVEESEVGLCDDGKDKLRDLIVDGLCPDDIDNETCPVFLDTLSEILTGWKLTGVNEERRSNKEALEDSRGY